MTQSIRLRPTTSEDLSFVLNAEQHQDNRAFILHWAREHHEAALHSPDLRHVILERESDSTPVGYAILEGVASSHQDVQLRRIVVTEKSQGYGQVAIELIKTYVFEELKVHRLWLDVKETNNRAQYVYSKHGFVTEGTMRECIKVGDRFESFVVMSILEQEYHSHSE